MTSRAKIRSKDLLMSIYVRLVKGFFALSVWAFKLSSWIGEYLGRAAGFSGFVAVFIAAAVGGNILTWHFINQGEQLFERSASRTNAAAADMDAVISAVDQFSLAFDEAAFGALPRIDFPMQMGTNKGPIYLWTGNQGVKLPRGVEVTSLKTDSSLISMQVYEHSCEKLLSRSYPDDMTRRFMFVRKVDHVSTPVRLPLSISETRATCHGNESERTESENFLTVSFIISR